MLHRNAPLSELGRLRLARTIVEQGWSQTRAAERFQVSRPTAHRWATRFRDQGPAGMADRSSRPYCSPGRTPTPVVGKVVHLRWHQRLGPAQMAPGSVSPPPPCRPSWSAAGSAAWPPWTGPPASRSAATSTLIPGPWSPSTSRSWATFPPVVATGSWAERLECPTTRPTGQVASSAVITTRGKATGSSTPPLMTTPGWPMPRSTPMRPARPRSGSSSGLRPGSLPAAWSSSRC